MYSGFSIDAWIASYLSEGECMQRALSYERGQCWSDAYLLFPRIATTDRVIRDATRVK